MAKKTSPKSPANAVAADDTVDAVDALGNPRFEYRVWGRHAKAQRKLAKLADNETREQVDDCYLLTDDDAWNVKVRGNTLKLKRLVAERKGFERWVSGTYHPDDELPAPFEELCEELDLDRVRSKGSYSLSTAIDELDPELGVTAVFVAKRRRRYDIGLLRAEVTEIVIKDTKESLTTLAIEGENLGELIELRKQLGLKREPNVPVHQAIAA